MAVAAPGRGSWALGLAVWESLSPYFTAAIYVYTTHRGADAHRLRTAVTSSSRGGLFDMLISLYRYRTEYETSAKPRLNRGPPTTLYTRHVGAPTRPTRTTARVAYDTSKLDSQHTAQQVADCVCALLSPHVIYSTLASQVLPYSYTRRISQSMRAIHTAHRAKELGSCHRT